MVLMSPFNLRMIAPLCLVFASLAACNAEPEATNPNSFIAATSEQSSAHWSMQQVGNKGNVSILFSCEKPPFVGGFQQCGAQVSHLDKAMFAESITIEGGMRAHGHGLPTSPTLTATSRMGHYQLKGLKYSMPGAWTIGFLVTFGSVSEQVIFDFTI